ncbi:hypothetical protein KC316_g13186, partial [Hortaea werneckii]
MPSTKGEPTDPELREKIKEEVKNEEKGKWWQRELVSMESWGAVEAPQQEMEHNAPHKNSVFEGYYSKFDLPSGAHVALIICQVKTANERPYKVSFSYVPFDAHQYFQKQVWAERIDMVKFSEDNAFGLEVPGVGYAR